MTDSVLFKNTRAGPCALSQQVDDLRAECRIGDFPDHHLKVVLEFIDGSEDTLLLRNLYRVFLVGTNTIYLEAVTTWGGLINDDYQNVLSVSPTRVPKSSVSN
ncbi:hypothetical protein CL632_02275 [bacterium]|jgi:hypothetical protein|nr:hypothetical protein [bacterium]MDP6571688.1 hypothetical protein [Patescibacteria group bacterium]|tara:strand:- start:14814 stop:15122 length:309 start_codon:yes stop_codon:yes gene_type:complete